MIIVDILFAFLFLFGIGFILLCFFSKHYQSLTREMPWIVSFSTLIIGMVFGYAFASGLNYETYQWSLMAYFAFLTTISIGSLTYSAVFKNELKKRNLLKGFLLSNFILGLLYAYSMFVPTPINKMINSAIGEPLMSFTPLVVFAYIISLLLISAMVGLAFAATGLLNNKK
jgi:hypothetical protein